MFLASLTCANDFLDSLTKTYDITTKNGVYDLLNVNSTILLQAGDLVSTLSLICFQR
jgi:hypothetical protein